VSIPVAAPPDVVVPETPTTVPQVVPAPAVTPATATPANGWFKFFSPFAVPVSK
jgi:hypothetical protein